MDSRIDASPAQYPSRSRLELHAAAAGPRQRAPSQGVAGRTWSKRAQTASPSKATTTAQNPSESSAARSQVTSRSPVAKRPPTTARAAGSEARTIDKSVRPPGRNVVRMSELSDENE